MIYDRVELIDMEGRPVKEAIIENVLHAAACSKGLYFLRFYKKDHSGVVTKKIVIQ